ncbi:unnamed protein product [Prunus armeniaca]
MPDSAWGEEQQVKPKTPVWCRLKRSTRALIGSGESSNGIYQNRSNVLTGRSTSSAGDWCLLSVCRHSIDLTSMNRWSMLIEVSAWLTEFVRAV